MLIVQPHPSLRDFPPRRGAAAKAAGGPPQIGADGRSHHQPPGRPGPCATLNRPDRGAAAAGGPALHTLAASGASGACLPATARGMARAALHPCTAARPNCGPSVRVMVRLALRLGQHLGAEQHRGGLHHAAACHLGAHVAARGILSRRGLPIARMLAAHRRLLCHSARRCSATLALAPK